MKLVYIATTLYLLIQTRDAADLRSSCVDAEEECVFDLSQQFWEKQEQSCVNFFSRQ